MEWLYVGAVSALWFGILTSISPCPLATNIAAMSYIGKSLGSPRAVLSSGLLYTLGRVLAYMALGVIVIKGLLSIPGLAQFLERYMNLLIGPLLIIVALFLLEVWSFSGPSVSANGQIQRWAAKSRYLGPVLLGLIFALTLCPVSAGLFFGSLVPLSIQYKSTLILPAIYGIGTGLPVIGFAVVLGFSAGSLGKVFNRLKQFEFWARRVTGVVFLLAGAFLIYRNLSGYVRLVS
ncbi:MAG: sulfite exporter TauE/SafE family protein [Candidatus Sumerlaeaceae bacterium]|nr:sulfite exporter TauE/SafE family protein [Candidatus Sumerlaeaceae bacterium]